MCSDIQNAIQTPSYSLPCFALVQSTEPCNRVLCDTAWVYSKKKKEKKRCRPYMRSDMMLKNKKTNKNKAISAGCTACLSIKPRERNVQRQTYCSSLCPCSSLQLCAYPNESWCTQEAFGTNKSLLIKKKNTKSSSYSLQDAWMLSFIFNKCSGCEKKKKKKSIQLNVRLLACV